MSELSADERAFITRSLRAALGNQLTLSATMPATGGCIHRTIRVDTNQGPFFVKLGDGRCGDMFDAEADGLRALAASETFAVPDVITCHADEMLACLCLEHLDLAPLTDRAAAHRAGEQLARLHDNNATSHGWRRDNYLGLTPQKNTPSESWPRFIAERRISPLLERLNEPTQADVRRSGAKLVARLPALLVEHKPTPSLLHGDLWHGNIGALPDGRVAIFDPAVSYGDADFDLAMATLFGGFPDSFFAAYRAQRPPQEGHEIRQMLYRLYHVLNHLVLFGNAYRGESQRLIDKLLASTGR